MWNISLKYESSHKAWVGSRNVEIAGCQGPVDVTLVKPSMFYQPLFRFVLGTIEILLESYS
jgi:hypothetical protein